MSRRDYPTPTLTELEHHVSKREPCCDCGTRVFTYSTEHAPGLYLKYRCTMCHHRFTGVPLCRYCQRPIKKGRCTDTWLHADANTRRYRHTAEPEPETRPWKGHVNDRAE